MKFISIHQLKSKLLDGTSILGLDLGSKTIGLAVSDPTCLIASPLVTIRRKKFSRDVFALKEIIDSNKIGGLIFGLPISMDGTEGPRCQSTRQFARNLQLLHKINIAFWDERLSSAAVNRFLIAEVDMSRARRSEIIDKMAATYILQGALDSLSAGTCPERLAIN